MVNHGKPIVNNSKPCIWNTRTVSAPADSAAVHSSLIFNWYWLHFTCSRCVAAMPIRGSIYSNNAKLHHSGVLHWWQTVEWQNAAAMDVARDAGLMFWLMLLFTFVEQVMDIPSSNIYHTVVGNRNAICCWYSLRQINAHIAYLTACSPHVYDVMSNWVSWLQLCTTSSRVQTGLSKSCAGVGIYENSTDLRYV